MENDNASVVFEWSQQDQGTLKKAVNVCCRCKLQGNVDRPKHRYELEQNDQCSYPAWFCDDEWKLSESVLLILANGPHERAVMLENVNYTCVSSEDLSLSNTTQINTLSRTKLVRSQKHSFKLNKNKTRDGTRLHKLSNNLKEFSLRNNFSIKYETTQWLHIKRHLFITILFLLVFISGISCEGAAGLGADTSFSNESRVGLPRQSWQAGGHVAARASFNMLDAASLPSVQAERNVKLNCSKQNGAVVSGSKSDPGKMFLRRLYKGEVKENNMGSTHSDPASVAIESQLNAGIRSKVLEGFQTRRGFITQGDEVHDVSRIVTQAQKDVRRSKQIRIECTNNTINQQQSKNAIEMTLADVAANEKRETKPSLEPELHNIVSNDGYSPNIRSLSRGGSIFWASPAGSLDIPTINLENAYKVRNITSEHPQTGEPSSESNSIFRGQLQKVLSGTSFSDNDFTRSRTRVKRTGGVEKSRRLKVRNLNRSYKSQDKKGLLNLRRHIFSGSRAGRVFVTEDVKINESLLELEKFQNVTKINISHNMNDALRGPISVNGESLPKRKQGFSETITNIPSIFQVKRQDQNTLLYEGNTILRDSRVEPVLTTNKMNSSNPDMTTVSQQNDSTLERQIRSVDGEAETLSVAATAASDYRPVKKDQIPYNGETADTDSIQLHVRAKGPLQILDSSTLSANNSILKEDQEEQFERSEALQVWIDSVHSHRVEDVIRASVSDGKGKSVRNSTSQIVSLTEPHFDRNTSNSHHKILHGGLRRDYLFDYTPEYGRRVSNVFPKFHSRIALTSVLPHFANTNMTQFASSFPSTSSIEHEPTTSTQFYSSTSTGLSSGLNSRAERSSNNRRGKVASGQADAATNCSLGYFGCNDGSCVLADRYCNGDADCPKGEDEPPHCTPCDHIYYGEVGRTYEVQVQWPRRNLRDSTCNVTLVAAGGPHGDIVQVALRKFSLGKFNSHTDHGCPHGHMQIVENMRQYRPGYWCGDGVGLDIYYSETPSVTLLLTRLKMDNDLTAIDSFPGFYFKMAYKFIRQTDAIVRYGSPEELKFTGIRSSSSPCHVRFPGCDTKPCYIQSPNFPGLYPRNTTCYYHITQNQTPFGKRALITLHQRRAQLINVKSSKQPLDTEERHLKLYDDCFYVGDYVRIYDGNSTKSPVLLTFCRGAALPEITSSGPSLLIEFTTSPYDSPNHESPWKYLNGFELVARTKFVSRTDNVGSSCHQILTPQKNSSGWISAPLHSVTPNTTCVWEFRGRPGHVIWIIFARYARETQVRRHHTTLCEARLTIKDGSLGANDTDLASHCRDTLPRTCDRIGRLVHGNTTVPPCGYYESYVTQGEQAIIMQEYGEGSLVTKIRFLAKYEFVDARQVGEKRFSPCSRLIFNDDVLGPHKLSAPRDVFLYGRGGRKAVHCSWLIQGKSTEAVRLTIHSMKVHGSTCRTLVRPLTENLDCDGGDEPIMKLHLSEVPWEGVEVPRACLCSTEVLPHTIESRGSALLLNMTLSGMGPGDDYNHFNFDVEYEFLTKPECPGGTRRLDASAGDVLLGSQDDPGECDTRPWLLEAPLGHSFLVTLPKATQANESCSTDSRLVLRTPGSSDSLMVACPAAANDAVFRFIWPPIPGLKQQTTNRAAFQHDVVRGVPQLVAQWEPRRASALSMQWAHLRDPAKMAALEAGFNEEEAGTSHCKELCEALGACLVRELWCDGTPHCPDGSDETIANCLLERIPWLYLTMVGLTSLVLILISASTIARQHRQKSSPDSQSNHQLPPPPHPAHHHHHHHHHHQQPHQVTISKKALAKEARRASTQETILPAKDNHHRLSAYTPEEYTDMDFETTV